MRGTMLGLSDRVPTLSGEIFVRGLPRENMLGVDELDEFLVVSTRRIESFRDDKEAGMKRNGLLLLDEEYLDEEDESRRDRSGMMS